MFGQESFATCCMIMLHVSSHNVIRRSVLCQWTFYKFKWWVRWVKTPFSQKSCAHPPLFPKIFVLHRGTSGEKFAKQSASFVWNGISICDTSKKESKRDKGHQGESVLFHSVWSDPKPPCFSFALQKGFSRVILVHSFSDVHIYIYVYIYMFIIASYSYRGDSLTWVFRFVSA